MPKHPSWVWCHSMSLHGSRNIPEEGSSIFRSRAMLHHLCFQQLSFQHCTYLNLGKTPPDLLKRELKARERSACGQAKHSTHGPAHCPVRVSRWYLVVWCKAVPGIQPRRQLVQTQQGAPRHRGGLPRLRAPQPLRSLWPMAWRWRAAGAPAVLGRVAGALASWLGCAPSW